MRAFFYSLLLSVILTTPADVDRLVLGFDNYPPFTGRDGKPRVAVDLLDIAMRRLGHNVDMIMVRPGQFSRIFTEDRIEASPALWHSPEREGQFYFTNPIFQNRLLLVGKKGSGAKDMSLEDLKDRRLAVVEGYAYGEELSATGVLLVEGKSDQDNMRKLLEGDVDFALVEELLLTYAGRSQGDRMTSLLELGKTPLITKNLHIAVKKNVQGAKELVKDLNGEIKTMMMDGSYHMIMGVARLVADVDADGSLEALTVGNPANLTETDTVTLDFTDRQHSEKPEEFYLVGGKMYGAFDEIPQKERDKMKVPEPTVDFVFDGFR